MTVYVDQAIYKKSPNGRTSYAHLTADTEEELHLFAAKAGIKPHFFHKKSKYLHYDTTAAQRPSVIELGAKEITSQELAVIARKDDDRTQA
jgi:hypothetical protein